MRDLRATIATMPRRVRHYDETSASRELDALVAEREDLEKRLEATERKIWDQTVVVAREKNRITIAEIARRVGYSREHVSRFITDANKREGWQPDVD